jgi:hypothetical protein
VERLSSYAKWHPDANGALRLAVAIRMARATLANRTGSRQGRGIGDSRRRDGHPGLNMESMRWFLLFAAANVALLTLLAMNISRLRMKLRVSAGDGDHPELRKAIRAHGNGVEHVSVFAIVVVALVLAGTSAAVMAPLVLGFTATRILHAVGTLGRGPAIFRTKQLAAGLCYLVELAGTVALIIAAIGT